MDPPGRSISPQRSGTTLRALGRNPACYSYRATLIPKSSCLKPVDTHRWIISAAIYAAVCFILVFLFIGVPLLMVLGVLAIAFPIVGGIKANNGEVWKYPLSIQFFR